MGERFAVDLQEGVASVRLALGDARGRIFIRPYTGDDMRREHYFDVWPTELVPAESGGLVVDYRSVALVKAIVQILAARYRFWIDTNMEPIYSIEGFARRCQEDTGEG